jgi:hypothetical protein
MLVLAEPLNSVKNVAVQSYNTARNPTITAAMSYDIANLRIIDWLVP